MFAVKLQIDDSHDDRRKDLGGHKRILTEDDVAIELQYIWMKAVKVLSMEMLTYNVTSYT